MLGLLMESLFRNVGKCTLYFCNPKQIKFLSLFKFFNEPFY